jgi:hypothetical protein
MQFCTGRKQISNYPGLNRGEWGMTVSVYDISLWSDENVDDGYTKNN